MADLSCGLSDPQAQLSSALAKRDIRQFRIALDIGAQPLQPDNEFLSVYEKALSTYGCAEFVEECLRHGCSANYANTQLNTSAINLAAASRDPQILAVLLRQPDVLVDRKFAQWTPLNSLAKNLTSENYQDTFACMELLLNYGASPNIPDQREMTPLHYVVKNRKINAEQKRQLVEIFLRTSKPDVDTYRNGELRKDLELQFPGIALPEKASGPVTFDVLIHYLRGGNEAAFLEKFDEYHGENGRSRAQEELLLLLESIKCGKHEAFDLLVRNGADINMRYEGKFAAKTAVIWGNWRALEKLLKSEQLKLPKNAQLLHQVVNEIDGQPLDEFCDYGKCFELLLQSEYVDINELDSSNLTPLHYAVQNRNKLVIQALLRNGAYIGVRSKFGDLAIEDMPPELLTEHFDNCVQTNGRKPGDENFEIILNYMNLMRNEQAKNHSLPDEMTPLAFMAQSKEYRHLLHHPLVTSFLFLKWHRLSVLFYINFICFALFAAAVIGHTVLKFQESENAAITALFGVFTLIGIGYMTLRELLQLLISPRCYFGTPINYMELALIVLALLNCSATNYDRETQRVIAVFTILLVALELCLLVGSLPVLSISTHMLMLRAVSHSFLKSFTLYSIFVITFSLCFYLLFGKPEPGAGAVPGTDTDNGEFNKFSNPFAAVIKTIVMLTGEFDAGDIAFDTLSSYIVFLLFVVFMSIVLFNLLNGLAVSDTQVIKAQAEINGAICRTDLLARYEAVFSGRAGSSAFIVNHEPFRSICRRLINIYPNYITGRQIAILPNDGRKVLIPQAQSDKSLRVVINGDSSKTNLLPLKTIGDESEKRLLDPPVQFLPCCCRWLTGRCTVMDSRTVKLALAVLDKKTNHVLCKKRDQQTEERLQNIETKLNQLIELIQRQN